VTYSKNTLINWSVAMNRYKDMSVYFYDLSLDHEIKAVKAEELRKIAEIAHQKARPNRKRWSNV